MIRLLHILAITIILKTKNKRYINLMYCLKIKSSSFDFQ